METNSQTFNVPIAGFTFFSKAPSGGGTGGGFTPYQEVYNTGSGTSIIPGAAALVAEAYGKGGDGGTKLGAGGAPGGGGGSGAYSKKTFAVAAGDIGKMITWNTNNSGHVTVIGDAAGTNITDSLLNLSSGYGADGVTVTPGAGGTATGGTTNLSGNAGASSTGGTAPGPAGGLGGAAFTDGTSPGGGGGGGNSNSFDAGIGGLPKIIFPP